MATDRVARLEASVAKLLARAGGLSDELLQRDPAPDDWSAMKVLAHVAELVPFWAAQARSVAGRQRGGEPFGRTHDDPARITAVTTHAHDRLSEIRARIERGLSAAIADLSAIPADAWTRTGRHAVRGEMTVGQLVDQLLIEHVDEHTAQLAAAVSSEPPA